jgi:hypothetical protein
MVPRRNRPRGIDPTHGNEPKRTASSTQVLPFPLSQTHKKKSHSLLLDPHPPLLPPPPPLGSHSPRDFYPSSAAKDLPPPAGTLRRCTSSASPLPGDRAAPTDEGGALGSAPVWPPLFRSCLRPAESRPASQGRGS